MGHDVGPQERQLGTSQSVHLSATKQRIRWEERATRFVGCIAVGYCTICANDDTVNVVQLHQ